jgi:hypothetical protein
MKDHRAPDRQHGRVYIEADDASRGGDLLSHEPRDGTGSAGKV